MKLKVIVVEPKYQINIGYIARVSMNFGVKRLFFVRPRAKLTGAKAIMYSKHASRLLEHAKVYRSFVDAIKDCDIVIGTTGLKSRSKASFKRIFLIEQAAKRAAAMGKRRSTVGLLLGRDDTGLTATEMEKCDMLAYIGTDQGYPVLNISHALAIMLYVMKREEFSDISEVQGSRPERREQEYLFSLFDEMVEGKGNIRNKKAVSSIFRRIIQNSQPSSQELHALITALK